MAASRCLINSSIDLVVLVAGLGEGAAEVDRQVGARPRVAEEPELALLADGLARKIKEVADAAEEFARDHA